MMKRAAVKAAAKWPTMFFQGGISICDREAAALELASIGFILSLGMPRPLRTGLAGRGEERGDTVVERKLHPQARILFYHHRSHLRGAFRRSDVCVPIGDVLFHEVDRRQTLCRPWSLM